ncbi:SpoIIE family protein phosphatase [Lentzea sp. NPDC059081]|uniref:SpoIIE family protein phosphatase n=1 Tax=Lentzea sp. NPDC059081 TaxID=3346719 RepID=UPI0036759AC3
MNGADHDLERATGTAGVVRRVFDQMPLMVMALEGPRHTITAVTGAYRAWTGLAEMIGTTLREAFGEMEGQEAMDVADRVYETGVGESLRSFRTQFDRPDLGIRVDAYVDVNVTPFHGPDGVVTGLIIDAVDVTAQVRERKAAQQRVDDAERRYAEALDVIDALQREMLPVGVPLLPRVQVAASYLLAQADTAAGGDWFDAMPLPHGKLGLVVGDVVGHGLTASATMGQLRIVLSERLTATGNVTAAIRAADAAARRIPGARAATVCVAVLDPATGVLEYATAGHPPPLLVSGEARYLDSSGSRPLAVNGEVDRIVRQVRLREGDLVLFYTDGVLERPGRTLAECTVELTGVAADVAADRAFPGEFPVAADRLCTQTVELLTRVTGHHDDITLLAVQFVPAPPAFRSCYPASVDSLPRVRADFGDWLAGLRAGGQDADALRHAVVELATNAVEHAYIDSGADHEFVVAAELTDAGQVEVRVSDDGRWRAPAPSPDRGLGLQITADMVDHFRIEHDLGGTTSVVRHQMSRPARLLTADDLTSGPAVVPASRNRMMLFEPEAPTSPPCIRVTGPVDAHTAGRLEHAMTVAGATGTRSLTVDLGEATHLASAGVSALHRQMSRHRDNGTELRLVAPVATPADVVMTLVGLDHDTGTEGLPRWT